MSCRVVDISSDVIIVQLILRTHFEFKTLIKITIMCLKLVRIIKCTVITPPKISTTLQLMLMHT